MNLTSLPTLVAAAPSLRDYQRDAVARIDGVFAAGRRGVLFQLPTGGGKTIIFAHMVAEAARRGRRILILAHRVEIIEQISAALDRAGVEHGTIAPDHPSSSDAAVQIASVATIVRRLGLWANRFDFIVADEAHHSVSSTWARVLASQSRAHILGVTATPERLDGRGLREAGFEELVEGPSTAWLIEQGRLSPFVCFEPAGRPDMSSTAIRGGDYAVEDIRGAMGGVVIGSAVREYMLRLKGEPTVAFCVDIAHSREVAGRFRGAGIRAAHVDGDTSADERRSLIAGLGDGRIEVLCNCGLISEGVDVPALSGAILLRPTASLALYLQQVGRALRPAPGKDRALILDFAGNVARHGLPDARRVWSLDSQRRPKRSDEEASVRRCPSCGALNPPRARVCAECGADISSTKERAEIELALREARQLKQEDAVRLMPVRKQWEWAAAHEDRLRLVAKINNYKPGWVYYRRKELLEKQAVAGAGR